MMPFSNEGYDKTPHISTVLCTFIINFNLPKSRLLQLEPTDTNKNQVFNSTRNNVTELILHSPSLSIAGACPVPCSGS